MYNIILQSIPQSGRAETNEKILSGIRNGKAKRVPPEMVYNSYTGLGGLHELRQSDFENYYEYSEAKKEFEIGQFFTPHTVCKQMVELIEPDITDTVLDMCCGMGNFFNHLPNQHNAYGFDVDENAVTVARYLYPDAHIEKCDIRQYNPTQKFDMIIGNPPFNLDFDGTLSQFYYCIKASKVLKPAGLMMIIVPSSFLQSDFWEKTRVSTINNDFSFIGQMKLPSDAFASVGVEDFNTKIMVFSLESEHIESNPYLPEEFLSYEELKERITAFKSLKNSLKHKINRESYYIDNRERQAFEYKLKKYLFELKTHPHLQKHYKKAIALVSKFRNQAPPQDYSYTEYLEWQKNRLTYAKVLSVIGKYIHKQNEKPRKEVALVKTSYGFKLKGYAPQLLKKVENKYVSINDLVVRGAELPQYDKLTPKLKTQYKSAMKFVDRKRKAYLLQNQPFSEMEQVPGLEKYINSLSFINKEMEECWFTELQKQDMGLVFQKRYSLLNWQQGSGKTAVAYHFGKYRLLNKKVRNAIILAPAIATNLTWESFLKRNGEDFITLTKPADFRNIREGQFLLVSISMQEKFKRELKRYVKLNSRNICLLFDESDEITNPLSQRTKYSLCFFRRLKYKLLATGTTTRNNITELYSQIELLYNNSMNMICFCPEIYIENRDKDRGIESKKNEYYGLPFPAKNGANLFKYCFCPAKTTVFGIERQNQDIYNKEYLAKLIGKTIITRKFREFAGEKYEVKTHTVQPSAGEIAVYRTILEEFCRICNLYFNSTGDSKKDAALRLIRQITLLIKACSIPNLMEGYYGERYPSKTRAVARLLFGIRGKTAIGCTTLAALEMYRRFISERFPSRPLFVIEGGVSFKKRQDIISKFEATGNGVLICTQQSLKSSANIPSCNDVILESLQWNIPKMEQFYFRFIRLDSKDKTRVHFVTYEDSIEQNLMALVLTKERLNEFIKTGEVKEQSDIYEEFDVSQSVIESLLKREQNEEGKFYISWGSQRVS
ncbi:MAG: N-6 DNA methylase [Dysgonamonadaceae bacterium]|nr:N-6 DNA methylase [Dysgonamonadaceae bacterium]